MRALTAKRLMWGIGITVAITVATVAFIPDFDVRIPEDKVVEALDDRIPLIYESSGVEIQLRKAKVDFLKDGVALGAEVRMSGFGLGGKGTAQTTASVRYDDGAFYLSDLRLDDFEVTPSLATRVKMRAWKKARETFLADVEEDIRTREGDAALSEFLTAKETLGPAVRKALDESLGNIAVYRLEGGPAQYAAFLVLKDINFTETHAIATLSPAQAILKIATAFIILLIGILLGLDWLKAQRRNREEDAPI